MTALRHERDVLTADLPPGLLADFHAAGVLGLADVHTATALGRIGGESGPAVLLAVALAVRGLRLGSVCIDLTTQSQESFDAAEERVDVSGLAWPEPQAWFDACTASPLVAAGPDAPDGRPLRLADGLLYLERYWQQEELVRSSLDQRAALDPPRPDLERLAESLDRLFPGHGLAPDEPDLQKLAAAVCALRRVTVLAGGPGTGKTTTVARLLALLHDLETSGTGRLRVALAAPTGKAAARLGEAIREAAAQLDPADASRLTDLPTSTLHRLLGWRPESRSRFRHHAGNRLPYDVLVVDEMSMVSLTLMARLLEAVRPDSRLILVGDPDQLSSVEAGAVLADIAGAPTSPDANLLERLPLLPVRLPGPAAGGAVGGAVGGAAGGAVGGAAGGAADEPVGEAVHEAVHEAVDETVDETVGGAAAEVARGVVRLTHTWRFGGAIGDLAQAIRAADADSALAVLRSADPAVLFVETDLEPTGPSLQPLASAVVEASRATWTAARAGDPAVALTGLERHRLLCAHRRGPYGVSRWSVEVERWLTAAIPGYAEEGEWYPGRPLLITANDYELNLYNGDLGVVTETPGGVRAAFGSPRQPTLLAPVRLSAVQTVHAMTVHRAQGSQFGCVSFLVPPPDSPLLTRELLYTAVTRATDRVQIFGSAEAVRRAVERPASRASGLRRRLS